MCAGETPAGYGHGSLLDWESPESPIMVVKQRGPLTAVHVKKAKPNLGVHKGAVAHLAQREREVFTLDPETTTPFGESPGGPDSPVS